MKHFSSKIINYDSYQFYNYHPLKAAYIYISDVCNFHCKICNLPYKNKKSFVPLKEIKDKIKKAKELNLDNIIFTGQETILHPNIDEVIKWSFDVVGVNYIAIVTNGLAFASGLIQKKLFSLKKYWAKLYIGVSVNFYDANTFSEWSGHDKAVFRKWLEGFKETESKGIISYIDTILMKDMDIIRILEFLAKLTNRRSEKINLRVGELMPFGHDLKSNFYRLKYSLLETKKEIDRISCSHLGKIEFESFPTCVFDQESLKRGAYFIPNFQLTYENGIPIQYDPIVYKTYYSGPTENWLIDREKLKDSYERMFSHIKECTRCYYKEKCCGIPRAYLMIYGIKNTNQETKILKNLNWN